MKKLTPFCNLVNKIGSSEGHRAGSLQLVREAQKAQCLVFGVSQHTPFPAGQRGGTAHGSSPALPTSLQQPPALPAPQEGLCCNGTNHISVLWRYSPPLAKKISFPASYYFSIQPSSLRCLILTCRLFYI